MIRHEVPVDDGSWQVAMTAALLYQPVYFGLAQELAAQADAYTGCCLQYGLAVDQRPDQVSALALGLYDP